MTEQNTSSAIAEETKPSVETAPHQEPSAPKSRSGVAGIALGAIAIAVALALGAGLYLYGKQQTSTQTATNDALATQLTELQKQQDKQAAALEETIKQQAAALDEAKRQQSNLAHQLDEMQQKITTISGNDTKTWLLAQSDFLVKLAGRKIWSDQDVTTAAALLKSADASLADMNDPSLIAVRRALTDDIGSLAGVAQVDYDGIILKLNQLANQVDNLRLADNDNDGAPMDSEDGNGISSTVSEWRQNLVKSWHSFMDSFITIRRRDETAVPLLAPNQDIYLRENIRSRLLIAAQAVLRHQEETYKQSLENVSTWVRAYYDTEDAATKAFLDELDGLSQESITMDIPQTLQSQALLEKLMQTRVRNLLAQPAPTASAPTEATPEQTPAETAPAEAAPEQTPTADQGE